MVQNSGGYFLGIIAFSFCLSAAEIRIEPTFSNGVYPDDFGRGPFPEVRVTSEFEIRSVTATYDTQVFNLAFSAPLGTWRPDRVVDITNSPSGVKTIQFTATDVFGATAQTNATFIVDFPPEVDFISPVGFALARPLLHVVVEAEDDRDIPLLHIINLLQVRTNRIDTFLDLSANEGSVLQLRVFARDDAAPRFSVAERTVLSLSNPRYQPVFETSGPIRDFSSNAVLYIGASNSLVHLNRSTGESTILATNFHAAQAERLALLTPTGALFRETNTPAARLIDYNNGSYLDLGEGYNSAQVAGRYALLMRPMNSGQRSRIYDFITRTNIEIPVELGFAAHLAENGAVVFNTAPVPLDNWSHRTGNSVYFFRDNQLTLISQSTNHIHETVQTDGTNAVWLTVPDGFVVPRTYEVHAHTAAGFQVLNSNFVFQVNHTTPPILAKNGWIAFPENAANSGVEQLWLRSPAGVVERATFYSENITLRALRADGAMVGVLASPFEAGQVTFIPRGTPPRVLSPNFGAEYKFVGDQLYAKYIGALFEVEPEGDLISITSAQKGPGLTLNTYVTSTAPATFAVEHSTNFTSWSVVSTNSVTGTLPTKIELRAPPGFVRLKKL